MNAHSIMLRLVNAVENDNTEDLYEIVNEFRNNGPEDTGIINSMFSLLDKLENEGGNLSCNCVRISNEGSLLYIVVSNGIPISIVELYGENDDIEMQLVAPSERDLETVIAGLIGE